jgi:hypothetical protein
MTTTYGQAFLKNFLGTSPDWYKLTIVGFLILNPLLFFFVNPFLAGWVLIAEFIFTLAMALKCYPLQSGGLLAFEAIVIGMASPETVYHEAEVNLPVILLLIFMVAGISFLKEMLLFAFTKLLVRVKSKISLSLLFAFLAAFLSAFLDALTVTAVVIAVASGFYGVYHKVASGLKTDAANHDMADDGKVTDHSRADLEQFRSFLRNIMMHAAIGTALGGVSTIVGEPQNLLIGTIMGWDFVEFYLRVAPISIPVLIIGLLTTIAVEKFKIAGYGTQLPDHVRSILEKFDEEQTAKLTKNDIMKLWMQAAVAVFLVLCLALHLAEVGHHRSGGDRAGDILQWHHGRAPHRPRLPGGTALYRPAGGVLRGSWRDPRAASVHTGDQLRAGDGRQCAAGGLLHRQRRALDGIGQRVRGHGLHHGSAAGLRSRAHQPGTVRTAGGGHQYRHQHPLGGDTERAGGVPVSADLRHRSADTLVLWTHGDSGLALHNHAVHHRIACNNVFTLIFLPPLKTRGPAPA